MLTNLNRMEGQEDLRIVEHLDMQKLPESVQQMLSLASTPEERDIILIATLAAASACVPNLYFTYGPTGKKYYANLQCFILAAAASGKGIANQALEMARVIDEQYPLLIAGDSTLAAFYKALEEQGGVGYMHESEGSVITDIWRTSAANYNTALRKAAEHEPISRNRVKDASEIKNPRLSMLLTGTFGQYKALVPSVENGYFSRLLTVVIKGTNPFDKRYVSSRGGQSAIPRIIGQKLLRTYEALMNAGECEWSLTDAQKERLGEHLETEYGTLIGLLGENFHSAVIRMAVQIERIAMILTAMRGDLSLTSQAHDKETRVQQREKNEDMPDNIRDKGQNYATSGDKNIAEVHNTIFCADEDYETAEMIGNKLLMHLAAAYRMIDGDAQDVVPEIKPIDQRTILLNLLPEEFESKLLIAEAQSQGIPQSTVMRWCGQWIDRGILCRPSYGHYKKIA
ncbi:MAG: DUF3987 domain-containing protein [Paludibacteraceae bacterium]|nr:DUF3987 domain-containing protein [Paludibacteraceae bacterium]